MFPSVSTLTRYIHRCIHASVHRVAYEKRFFTQSYSGYRPTGRNKWIALVASHSWEVRNIWRASQLWVLPKPPLTGPASHCQKSISSLYLRIKDGVKFIIFLQWKLDVLLIYRTMRSFVGWVHCGRWIGCSAEVWIAIEVNWKVNLYLDIYIVIYECELGRKLLLRWLKR